MNTIKIWVSESSLKYVDLSDLNNPEMQKNFFYTQSDMADMGYTQLGVAVIENSFFSRTEIQNNAVDSLKVQMQEVRAKAEKQVNELQDKINQLLAIEN
jgi:hypothetical protein